MIGPAVKTQDFTSSFHCWMATRVTCFIDCQQQRSPLDWFVGYNFSFNVAIK